MAKTKTYTVVGFYEDTTNYYVDFFEATTPKKAAEKARTNPENEAGFLLNIVAVFEGDHFSLWDDQLGYGKHRGSRPEKNA